MKKRKRRQQQRDWPVSLANLVASFFFLFFVGCVQQHSVVHYEYINVNISNATVVQSPPNFTHNISTQPDLICDHGFMYKAVRYDKTLGRLLMIQPHEYNSTTGSVSVMLKAFYDTQRLCMKTITHANNYVWNVQHSEKKNTVQLLSQLPSVKTQLERCKLHLDDLAQRYPRCWQQFNMEQTRTMMNDVLSKLNTLERQRQQMAWEFKDYLNNVRPLPLPSPCTNTLCRIVEAYNITTHLQYQEEEGEIIKQPQQTLKDGGGDCEDLTLLFLSFLSYYNVNARLALTDHHAFALLCEHQDDVINYSVITQQAVLSQALTTNVTKSTALDAFTRLTLQLQHDVDVEELKRTYDVEAEVKGYDIKLFFTTKRNVDISVNNNESCHVKGVGGVLQCFTRELPEIRIENKHASSTPLTYTLVITPRVHIKHMPFWFMGQCLVIETTAGPDAWMGWINEENMADYVNATVIDIYNWKEEHYDRPERQYLP